MAALTAWRDGLPEDHPRRALLDHDLAWLRNPSWPPSEAQRAERAEAVRALLAPLGDAVLHADARLGAVRTLTLREVPSASAWRAFARAEPWIERLRLDLAGRAWKAADVLRWVGHLDLGWLTSLEIANATHLPTIDWPFEVRDYADAPPSPEWVHLPEVADAVREASLPRLSRLALDGCGVDDVGLEALVRWPPIARLRALSVASERIGSRGLRAIADGKHLGALQSLAVAGCELTVPVTEAFGRARRLGALRALRLTGDRVLEGPERVGPALVAGVEGLPSLRVLDLSGRPVGDAVVRIAEAPGLSRLTELALARSAVGDRGAMALAQSPHADGLERLDLRGHGGNGSTAASLRNRYGPEAAAALIDRFGHRVALLDERP